MGEGADLGHDRVGDLALPLERTQFPAEQIRLRERLAPGGIGVLAGCAEPNAVMPEARKQSTPRLISSGDWTVVRRLPIRPSLLDEYRLTVPATKIPHLIPERVPLF